MVETAVQDTQLISDIMTLQHAPYGKQPQCKSVNLTLIHHTPNVHVCTHNMHRYIIVYCISKVTEKVRERKR